MLKQRVLSALAMMPPALAAIWFGGLAFELLTALIAGIMAWEWNRMTEGKFGVTGMVTATAAILANFLALDQPLAGLGLIIGAALLMAVGLGWRNKAADRQLDAKWPVMGALYVGLPILSLVWLRGEGDWGRVTVFWLFFAVWATDIGAYAFGRLIGGPLLAPRISPKKTWAGLAGGVICASLVGLALGAMMESSSLVLLGALSGGLAVVAQIGDLAESGAKRRFGVKDSSAIIPGHGGVLDRVDGLIAAAPVVALVVWLQGGGSGLWQ